MALDRRGFVAPCHASAVAACSGVGNRLLPAPRPIRRGQSVKQGGKPAMRTATGGAPLRIALLGSGVVGSQVARLLAEQAADLAARAGGPLQIAGIAVRRPELGRPSGIDGSLLTGDAVALVTRPDVDIVVELIGGIE